MAPTPNQRTTESRKKEFKTRNDSTGDKKPFNKVQWRQQKYSHKAKLQRFEEQRRKSVIYKYRKEMNKSSKLRNDQSFKNPEEGHSSASAMTKGKQKQNLFQLAKENLKRKAEERELNHQKVQKDREDRKAALQKYHKEKIRKNKILSKKTKKGQPVMAGRMELLLEKIQKMVGSG